MSSLFDNVDDGMDAYTKKIAAIPLDQLSRRLDFRTKVVAEEMLSLSIFMKKSLIYLLGIATLSVYLHIISK